MEINKNFQLFSIEIEAFFKNNSKSCLIICGPRGVGKSTILLTYLTFDKIPRLYFSIKKMINFPHKKRKKMALYETLYIFNDKKEMEKFNQNYNKLIPNSEDLFEFIIEYIKLIIEFYKDKQLRKKIIIVLDDYDNSLDTNNNISYIIQYIHENRNKLLLFILGEYPFIYKKFYQYLLNNKQNYQATYWDLSIDKDNLEDDILKLPMYYYKYQIIKKNIIRVKI